MQILLVARLKSQLLNREMRLPSFQVGVPVCCTVCFLGEVAILLQVHLVSKTMIQWIFHLKGPGSYIAYCPPGMAIQSGVLVILSVQVRVIKMIHQPIHHWKEMVICTAGCRGVDDPVGVLGDPNVLLVLEV